jgi:prepilin-type processing-associated H-X9-DG protein
LPALNRARERARAAQCLSNIRQLSLAIVSFANDHKGKMPAAGGTTPYSVDPVSGAIDTSANIAARYNWAFGDDSDGVKVNRADWICWSRHQDPFNSVTNTAPNENITYSALTPYLNAKFRMTPPGDYRAANNANPALDGVYRCPSDYVEQRPAHDDPSHGYYRYSYAMNTLYASGKYVTAPFDSQGNNGPWAKGQRCDGTFTGKISSIKNASQKILLICQDEKTVDDGEYKPNPYNWNPSSPSDSNVAELVASRHDRQNLRANSKNLSGGNNNQGNQDCQGNVGFCDGHAEFFGRKDALRQKYTGNPNPDPNPF